MVCFCGTIVIVSIHTCNFFVCLFLSSCRHDGVRMMCVCDVAELEEEQEGKGVNGKEEMVNSGGIGLEG